MLASLTLQCYYIYAKICFYVVLITHTSYDDVFTNCTYFQIPASDDEQYTFLYIAHGNHVVGVSSSFRVVDEEKLDVMEIERLFTVVQGDGAVCRSPSEEEFHRLTCSGLFYVLLAHLSRRLTGELIGYPWSGVRPLSVVVRSNFQTSSPPKPLGQSKAKFYVEPPCTRHLGHMTKMAVTPICGKTPSKIFFFRTGRPIFTKLGM